MGQMRSLREAVEFSGCAASLLLPLDRGNVIRHCSVNVVRQIGYVRA